MTLTIYYFSATGNTLQIAKIMADRLGAELLPMTSHMNDICESRKIGFLFPTYFWGVPKTVVSFIEKLQITAKDPYLFAVSTCGGIPGGVLGFTKNLLASKNLSLSYGATIRMVPNFIEEYNPKAGWAEKLSVPSSKSAVEATLNVMSETRIKIPKITLKDKLFYKIYTDMKVSKDRGFYADENCTGCGICSRVCPNQNIRLNAGKPEFYHRCEHCTACIHWCPQSALQWKSVTKKRIRYHHPEITLADILTEMRIK